MNDNNLGQTTEMTCETMSAPWIDNLSRGYLASNQLASFVGQCDASVEATVATTLSNERRQFSWLWDSTNDRALLVNRITGTLFDPETGQALYAAPRLVEAPILVPALEPGKRLPVGVFTTAPPNP